MIDCLRLWLNSLTCEWRYSLRLVDRLRPLRPRKRLRRFPSSFRRSVTPSAWVSPSLNRPGGNVTGMSLLNSELVAKSAQLLKEAVPAAAVIAFLVNPSGPSAEIYVKEVPATVRALGIQIPVLNASTEHDLDEAFASLGKLGVSGLVVPAEPFFDSQRERIVSLAVQHAVPMISSLREYVVAGGLMSYGPSLPDSYRRAGIYVGRVLKGEKPADLPVMQPTKFDMVINAKTAKTLGLKLPDNVLALADEVIE